MEKMSFDSIHSPTIDVFPRRANTIHTTEESHVHTVTVYMHVFNPENQQDRIVVELQKRSTTEELIEKVLESRKENAENEELQKAEEYELYEMIGTVEGQTFKERRLDRGEYPVAVQLIWSRQPIGDETAPRNRFVLRHGASRAVVEGIRFRSIDGGSTIDNFLAKFLTQPQDREYADLCMLPELTEQTLLHNLRDRFNSGHIYTYIGPILVAVNPFSFFPIYNPKYARLYCQSRNLGALPPHIFAIADVTYHNMLRIKENQCVVISGESGSGKTESTNHLLSHLITLSQKGSTGCSTELTLLNAAPVLEAFGNAVTLQNNNSSRFGKFIKINYRENGMVSGANVEIYLLEKSRIISQAKGERNYHVFYYLLEGCTDEEKKKYYLMKPKDYHYLNQNGVISVESINEKGEMEKLRKAMGSVGFCKETQNTVFSMISAVLLLGNVNYVKRHAYHSDENAYIENEEVVDMIAELLQIKRDLLLQALTMKRHIMKAETVVTRFSVNEATNTRDAMAKCLYNALFHWIVLRINEALIRRETLGKGYYIGILDIFGFEDVGAQWNSFEQLCINYANEHLQAYFNQHIFEFEQEEYRKEGIRWTDIEYTDNTECVQLFQSKPYGILRLIDEESNINTGTDESMLAKLNQFLKGNEYYETPQKKEPAFIVAHYAGKVKYQITGFREKNKDLMRQDVLNALRTSKSALLKAVLASDPIALHRWSIVRAVFRGMFAFRQKTRRLQRSESDFLLRVAPEEPKRRGSDSALSAFLRGELQLELPDFVDTSMFSTIVKNARRTPGAKSEDKLSTLKCLQILKETMGRKRISNKPTSVSKQFEHSLSRLMSTLAQATPYFIRCIKSNSEKIPNHFDDNIILRQLRYTGMLETVRIRRAGFSVRIEYTAFIQQYRILLKNGLQSSIEDVKEFIHNHPSLESDNVEYGVSKIFMRDAEKLILDDHLHKTIMQHISTLQQWFRAQIARKRYLRMKSAITKLQALIRGMLVRERIRRQAYAACIIQTNWRRYLAQSKYQLIRDAIIAIQAAFRGSKARKKFGEIPRKGKNTFRVQRVQAVTLPTFNLNDPRSLEAFASSDEESEGSTQAALDESDTSELGDDAIELDATFILEDTRLKLIDEPEPSLHTQRRQSLAATASTAKLKMIRRANSTESNTVMMREEPLKPLHLFSKKKATSKIAFTKAKKNLKALFGGRRDEEEKDEPMDKWTQHDWKICRLHRQEMCVVCGRNLPSFIIQAHKCQKCKMCVHRECISHTHKVACFPMSPRSPTRMPWDIVKTRHSNSPLSNVAAAAGTFSLTKTKQQTDPGTMIVECIEDLRDFSVFIFKKQSTLEENKSKRATIVDALFKKSLREFHMELIGYEAVLTEEHASLKYHDLITTFEGVLTKVCREEKVTFPTTLGVNAFRGFLNEFAQVQKRKGSRQKTASNKSIRKKRRRSDVTVVSLWKTLEMQWFFTDSSWSSLPSGYGSCADLLRSLFPIHVAHGENVYLCGLSHYLSQEMPYESECTVSSHRTSSEYAIGSFLRCSVEQSRG
ncbi:hypothetical protein WR25_13386 isoform B [Diploscapter pachys]|uniref:Phorbol-ester/DAG-type domain-containing protein n=1 Tax=Diploscapter pachys TaxID=2018661 RepID=A0A2A2J3F4_9BILA|nr:hypothetical protein WR25_13386 isoform B [Diploscapter pachys]